MEIWNLIVDRLAKVSWTKGSFLWTPDSNLPKLWRRQARENQGWGGVSARVERMPQAEQVKWSSGDAGVRGSGMLTSCGRGCGKRAYT